MSIVARTADYLSTPADISTPFSDQDVVGLWIELDISVSNVAAGGSLGKLALSFDGGATWTLKTGASSAPLVRPIISRFSDPDNHATLEVHALHSDGYWYSLDSGDTWTLVLAPEMGEVFYDLALAPVRNMVATSMGVRNAGLGADHTLLTGTTGAILAITADILADTFYCYNAAGHTFRIATSGGTAFSAGALNLADTGQPQLRGLAHDPKTPGMLYYANGSNGIWKSLQWTTNAQLRKRGFDGASATGVWRQVGLGQLVTPPDLPPEAGTCVHFEAGLFFMGGGDLIAWTVPPGNNRESRTVPPSQDNWLGPPWRASSPNEGRVFYGFGILKTVDGFCSYTDTPNGMPGAVGAAGGLGLLGWSWGYGNNYWFGIQFPGDNDSAGIYYSSDGMTFTRLATNESGFGPDTVSGGPNYVWCTRAQSTDPSPSSYTISYLQKTESAWHIVPGFNPWQYFFNGTGTPVCARGGDDSYAMFASQGAFGCLGHTYRITTTGATLVADLEGFCISDFISPDGVHWLAVDTVGNLWYSLDAGVTWTNNGLLGWPWSFDAVNSRWWLIDNNVNPPVVRYSDDWGATWTLYAPTVVGPNLVYRQKVIAVGSDA